LGDVQLVAQIKDDMAALNGRAASSIHRLHAELLACLAGANDAHSGGGKVSLRRASLVLRAKSREQAREKRSSKTHFDAHSSTIRDC
jgi:hypothetical protein